MLSDMATPKRYESSKKSETTNVFMSVWRAKWANSRFEKFNFEKRSLRLFKDQIGQKSWFQEVALQKKALI